MLLLAIWVPQQPYMIVVDSKETAYAIRVSDFFFSPSPDGLLTFMPGESCGISSFFTTLCLHVYTVNYPPFLIWNLPLPSCLVCPLRRSATHLASPSSTLTHSWPWLSSVSRFLGDFMNVSLWACSPTARCTSYTTCLVFISTLLWDQLPCCTLPQDLVSSATYCQ